MDGLFLQQQDNSFLNESNIDVPKDDDDDNDEMSSQEVDEEVRIN
jgi:hypothetical protein